MSEQVPIYIEEVALVDFKGFRGENKFSFVDEMGKWCRWTVFLGNNNTGKTNLLKAIACLEPKEQKGNNEHQNRFPIFKESLFFPIGMALKNIPKESTLGIKFISCNSKSKTYIATDEYDFTLADGIVSGKSLNSLESLCIYGYGVIRSIEKKGISIEKNDTLNAENLFNNSKLINFEDWLFQLDYASNNLTSPQNNREKATRRRELLTTVLTSEIFPEIKDIRFISDEKLNNYIEFQTSDGWHKMSELGYGYQATLSWMADFCKKMFERYPEADNPLKEPAVILIDEIDLHLHPQWQRSLIKSLSEIFAATQFIVTTHSPFIIQSMENVNLYTLQREGEHNVVNHMGDRSYIGWRIEEILSEVMGMEDNINTDQYNTLINQFDKALDTENYNLGKDAYDRLMNILHPQSPERKLLDIQFSQLAPEEDKA